MTARHCLAILADCAPAPEIEGLTVVEAAGFVAVLGPQPPKLVLTRRASFRVAAARMANLEALMAHGTVLPTLSNVALTEDQARIALLANRSFLARMGQRLDGKAQYQMRIGWEPEPALTRFRTKPEPLGAPTNAEDLVRRFRSWVDKAVSETGAEALALPIADGLVLNQALLVDAARAPEVDALAERIDALWPEGLTIRLVGPSPGVSFASIAMRRLSVKTQQKALSRLGLRAGASDEDIALARRGALKAGAPSDGPVIARAASIVKLAAGAEWPDTPIHELMQWSEDRAGPDLAKDAA